MNDFLYYIKGKSASQVTTATLAELGLPAWDKSPTCRCVGGGPFGGGAGVLFTRSLSPGRLVYRPEEQEWHDFGSFACGFWRDTKPGPDDLRRPVMAQAYSLELGDGNAWHIPVARLCDGQTGLPSVLRLGADGKVMRSPKREYATLYDYASTAFEGFKAQYRGDGEPPEVSPDFKFKAACAALSAVYFVGPAECSTLELLDEVNAETILCAIVDWPAFVEMTEAAKKNEAPSSAPGGLSS